MISTYWPHLLFYGLCTYRLALMLSSDTGPYGAFSKLRSYLKREAKSNKPLRDSKLHLGITCIRCDSVWCALAVAAYAQFRLKLVTCMCVTGDVVMASLALSAVAILLHRWMPPK